MDEGYASAYAALGRTHWWWRARDAIVLREVQRLQVPGQHCRILDVGSGDGRLFEVLARHGSVEGIEPDPIARGGGSPHGVIHLASFDRPLPVVPPFDVVLMLDVLEHLSEPVVALRLCHELLRPGGVLFVTVPALSALWTQHDEMNRHFLRYDRALLGHHLNAAGLDTMDVRYLFHSLVVPKLLVRAAERLVTPRTQPPTIPPQFLNRGLEVALQLEERLARPVARWLPGSSLLAIANRPEHAR